MLSPYLWCARPTPPLTLLFELENNIYYILLSPFKLSNVGLFVLHTYMYFVSFSNTDNLSQCKDRAN